MSETVQTIIVAVVVIAAGILLYRALRRKPGGCDSADQACGGCPLVDRCAKRKKIIRTPCGLL